MSYPDSVRYLYALGNELKAGAKFGLERMQTLLAALGNPERDQRFVHVAGTNGKGSTAAMIAAMLRAAGWKTGLFTSPHLIEPTERIRIDDQDVSSADFADAFARVHERAEQLLREGLIDAHPSYFETVTAMALLLFRERAEISVMEVGLGGRLDATNVIMPELCVITPVSYDHEAFLGNTLDSIAYEKAGILKAGVPVISAAQDPVADDVIARRASELGCHLIRTAESRLKILRITADKALFEMDGTSFECLLPGRHQIENAATAVLAGRQLRIPEDAIAAALRRVIWPGRLERVSANPNFILDGAHNPAGAAALAQYIREFYATRPVWIVYGAMRDKAVEEVTEMLFPSAECLIVTAPDFPRALRPETILQLTNHPNAIVTETVRQAIDQAGNAPPETTVFFTGSLYLVGEARALLLRK